MPRQRAGDSKSTTKDYGFIARRYGSKDVFIHRSVVQRAGLSSLVEGQNVPFDIVMNRRPGLLRRFRSQWQSDQRSVDPMRAR